MKVIATLLYAVLASAQDNGTNNTNGTDTGDLCITLWDSTGTGWNGNTLSLVQDDLVQTFSVDAGETEVYVCGLELGDEDNACAYVNVGGEGKVAAQATPWQLDYHDNTSTTVSWSGDYGVTFLGDGDEASCLSPGTTDVPVTTDAPVTDAPVTDAPVTPASECTAGMLASEISALPSCGGATCGQCSDSRKCMVCIQPNDHPDNPPECGGGLTANHYCGDAPEIPGDCTANMLDSEVNAMTVQCGGANCGLCGGSATEVCFQCLQPNDHPSNPPECGGGLTANHYCAEPGQGAVVTTLSFSGDVVVDAAFIAGVQDAYASLLGEEGTEIVVTAVKVTTGEITLDGKVINDDDETIAALTASISATACGSASGCTVVVEVATSVAARMRRLQSGVTFTFTITSDTTESPADVVNSDSFNDDLVSALAEEGLSVSSVSTANVDDAIEVTVEVTCATSSCSDVTELSTADISAAVEESTGVTVESVQTEVEAPRQPETIEDGATTTTIAGDSQGIDYGAAGSAAAGLTTLAAAAAAAFVLSF